MGERVLGIDPGTVRMGYGLLEAASPTPLLLACGVLRASQRQGPAQRLYALYHQLCQRIEEFRPSVMAVEQPFVPRQEQEASVRTAIVMGQAQAVALLAAGQFEIPVVSYAPAQVKVVVTEHGRGSKHQVAEMVRLLLGLDSVPRPADASDAVAVALCHLHYQGMAKLLERAQGPLAGARPQV
ncbi:MAG: crossover junction endodeoxyribonuclease RuvC [Chloroflexi bacterium]|nr:crossover junction endodeoxyribonuclease RuvC [Chloroflexota bacterium]